MKNKRLIPLIAVAALMATSCRDYEEHVLKGTLYADSARTVAAVGDTLTFRAGYDYEYGRYLGQSVTDAQGHWAFKYIENIANPYQNETSNVSFYPSVIIMHGHDTLYTGRPDRGELTLYPGCWRSINSSNTSDTTSTPTRNGVSK